MAGALNNEVIVRRLAARRSGVCLRTELVAAGLNADAIKRRLAQGRLRSVGRGVYMVDDLVDDDTSLFRAQSLVSTGLLSHRTSGVELGLAVAPGEPGQEVDLMVPANVNRRIDGIRLHRRRSMPSPCDVIERRGLRFTGPARTIVDLSAVVGRARLKHIVQTAKRDRIVTFEEVVACVDSVARNGVTGITKLRQVLTPLVGGDPICQSVLEEHVAKLLDDHGIDGFQRQYRPPWFNGRDGVVDFAHPDGKIILEADGLKWHGRDGDLIDDRRRDRRAAAHGWVTSRGTWAEVTTRPAAVADDIRAVVANRITESVIA